MYDTDENGDIIYIDNEDDLSEESKETYDEYLQDNPLSPEETEGSESDMDVNNPPVNIIVPGDSNIEYPQDNESQSGNIVINTPEYSIDYESLAVALSDVPSYTVYPSTTAVNVLTNVINHVDRNVGYVIVSGSDSNTTELYYSDEYVVENNRITLSSPVTKCRYYQYRPSSSSGYVYTYTVSSVGDTTFNLSNQLVYTNLKEGYPDVIPYKMRQSYHNSIIFCICILFLVFGMIKYIKNK